MFRYSILALFLVGLAMSMPIQDELDAQVENDMICTLCEFAVTQIRHYIQRNETAAYIEEQIKKTCSLELFERYSKVVS